jgi:hypothetical protein
MASVITPESFNAVALSVSPIKVNEKTGAKSCFLNYQGGKVLIQTAVEMRCPYGLNVFTGLNGEKAGNPDYSIDLDLAGYDGDGEIADYYKMMIAFENFAKAEGLKNRRQWFKDDDLDLKMVGKMFSSTIKFPKDKDGNPKPYPPTQKVKMNIGGKPEMATKFYDPEGSPLRGEPKALLGTGSKVTAILQCGGLWFAAGKFGITWRVNQVIVHSSGSSASVPEFAFVGFAGKASGAKTTKAAPAAETYSNQIDDEEEEATLSSAVSAMMPSVVQAQSERQSAKPAAPAPAVQANPFANVEVGEEEGDEVEPISVPKKPTITKKKVVLGKK